MNCNERQALVGAMLIDGTGRAPQPDSVVLVEGSTIRQVGSRAGNDRLPLSRDVDQSEYRKASFHNQDVVYFSSG